MIRPEAEQNKVRAYAEEQAFWDALVSAYRKRDIDFADLVHRWAEQKCSALGQFGADRDFRELCEKGCQPVALAIALKLLEIIPAYSALWRTAAGPPRRRKQLIRTITKAADVIESLHDALGFPRDDEALWPSSAPTPAPRRMIKSLRFYARGLNFFDNIAREAGVRSPLDFPKYLISAYVIKATGNFHDRRVSALVGSGLGNPNYDETAHKMWRSRNYKRLDAHGHNFVDLLCAIGSVTNTT